MTASRKKLTTLIAALAMLGAVTGCGIESDSASDDAGSSGTEAVYEDPTTGGTTVQVAKATPRTEGNIRIAGKAQGSLTEDLVDSYLSLIHI